MDSGIDVDMGGFSSLLTESSPSGFKYDPLLLQGRNSPIEFKYESDNVATIDFTSPAKMYIEDTLNSNITPFMDAVPDNLMDTLNSSILCSPASLAGDENPLEVFQDLRHTSTPKQVSVQKQPSECSQARKRIKFTDGGINRQSRSWHVLYDITSCNINSQNTGSFVKISDSFTVCPSKVQPAEAAKASVESPLIRKVPILRGNTRKRKDNGNLSCIESTRQSSVKEFLFPDRNPSVRERDKWLYYTGFTNYDLMFRVLSHISVPSEEGLTPFQILIMTLMRLKCDLDWKDLSHRFHIFEPVVYNLFHSTLSLLAYSLSDVIPWTLPPCQRSNMNITVLLYPLPFRFNNSINNIFLFLTDSRCPVLYVSEPLLSTDKPFTLLPSMAQYFNTDDLICVKGLSLKNHPTFFRVIKSSPNRMTYKYVEAKNCPFKAKFIKSCEETIRDMKQYKLLYSKVPFSNEVRKQIVTVISSFINIRSSDLVGDLTLKNIYKRSYKAPCAAKNH